ncbi:GNAT family N-acetyltransferase [Pseudoalteromonas sp. M8]|uniref:GNAT family N-acetyltransferase n=1 Tax=Pseudoalteromonas sp. M8 TaxID=2692624 RepID=UPI001BA762F7|nr:GNAT family N-acetyltransferase [Pseudoalteromonas sp. M8]QUI71403.1 GNAT family N-acetyltransferase [Pseudoalteromonas sp. M8]
MTYYVIEDASWPEILTLQNQAYHDVAPETVDILKSIWMRSLKSCFVFKQHRAVDAYLLAHPWYDEKPPSLFTLLPEQPPSSSLFLHDLVVSQAVSGQGIGALMIKRLVELATQMGYCRIRLVAVQNSVGFWLNLGFVPKPIKVCKSYGEDALLMEMKV